MKYFVHYVEDSSPKIKSFKTKRSMDSFLKKFSKLINHDNGYWVDFAFSGKILSCDDYYKKALKLK